MRELWASNEYYYSSYYYCPCIINDDGTAVADDDVSFPKVSFFSQPDSGYGEKSVSHVTVTDYHIYRSGSSEQNYPMYFLGWTRYGGKKTRREYRTTVNTVIETCWRGEEYNDDPTKADWFIRIKYTKPSNTDRHYVVFGDREWWCSPAYAQEYGMGGTHGTDHSTLQMYRKEAGHDLFRRYPLSQEQARKVYLSVASQHNVPVGLMSELYREAMNSITCNTNTIANVLQVVDTIKDVKSGNIGSLVADLPRYLKSKQFVKAASSSWLGYRYSYRTTKSDIEEYKEKLLPLFNQRTGHHIVRSGLSTKEGVAHCKVIYSDRSLNSAQELYVMLKRMGLCLDAYNAWDLVPLSFVVDWFLPIGDWLEDFSQNWVADSAIFDIATITTSWKWSHTIQDSNGWYAVTYYSRNVNPNPPAFESYAEDPSTKTILKRVVDASALIVG